MNQNLMIPWIRSKTPKATDITNLLEEVIRKKRGWNLDGSSEEYDFFHGCYGNPDSEYLFVAEIPNFSGCQVARQLYRSQPGMSWKSAWKISTGDLIYRISLSDNGKASTSLRQSKTVDLCPRHYLIVETVKIEKFSRFIGAFFITRS